MVGVRTHGAVSAFISAAFVVAYSAVGVAAANGSYGLFPLAAWAVLGADLTRVPVFMALQMPAWARVAAWVWFILALGLAVFGLLPVVVSLQTFQLIAKAYWLLNGLLAVWIVGATLREIGPVRPVGWLAAAMLLGTPLWEQVPFAWRWATWPLALVLWLATAGVHLAQRDSTPTAASAATDL